METALMRGSKDDHVVMSIRFLQKPLRQSWCSRFEIGGT